MGWCSSRRRREGEARAAERSEPEGVSADDADRLHAFRQWFASERQLVGRVALEELIERAIAHNGYDLHTLALRGGERRLANLRKLMRLAREYEQRFGRDLRGFLGLVGARAAGFRADPRESEAPVEGEALDAVRLMTIHRAKGLEFEIVAVADLGREPRWRGELLRIGADGRIGLRLSRAGTGKAIPALDYAALGEERDRAESAEERRIFYVAMTRAKERLILTGAAKLEEDGGVPDHSNNGPCAPIAWIAPALSNAGIEPVIVSGEEPSGGQELSLVSGAPSTFEIPPAPELRRREANPPAISYSSLADYERCGYRFYLERVLGLRETAGRVAASGALERGILVHELLERIDLRRPRRPENVPHEIAEMVEGFIASPLFERLAAAAEVRREESFTFLLQSGALITGALDVLARERDSRALVVDYKSDRLEGADPAEIVERDYQVQRIIYALAALRDGAREVEVAHVFLERPNEPVIASFSDPGVLERELEGLVAGVLANDFAVASEPYIGLCNGCPAEGGLCSWPLEVTRRDRPGAADVQSARESGPAPGPSISSEGASPEVQGRLF
jgi:ATP-dependent helicase/nuclease subunit A